MVEAVIWTIVAGGTIAVLYAIHRRYRWLAERGFVDDTKTSGGGPFFALREFIEPTTRHIRDVHEEQRHHAEEEAPGEGQPRDEPPRAK